LFRDLPVRLASSALARGRRVSLAEGEVLLESATRNHNLYLLLEGRLQIRPSGGASPAAVEVHPGECVGEFSIIDGEPTSARVVAAAASEVLALPEEYFWSDLLPQPSFVRNLMRSLTGRLRRSAQIQLAYEQVLQELQVARQIQSSMLPRLEGLFTEHPGVNCAAVMDAAAEVGGDFYDVFFLDDRHLFLTVGDVAGKGIGAALFMARCLTLLRNEALRRRTVRDVLARVNASLAEGNESGPFVAVFAAVLDVESGELRYANGGLGAPRVRRAGRWERPVMPRGLVLGVFPEFDYAPGRLRLAPGDALAVFTDGVTDAVASDGEMFGESRLDAALAGAGNAAASAVVAAVQESVRSFARCAPPADDFTLLVLERGAPA
jgi:phosphoserine phosphatase RsbU/P